MTRIGGREFTGAVLLLLAIGIGLSYGGSFGVGFYFDDKYGIVNNAAVHSLANVPSFFFDPHAYWTVQGQEDLRPVLLATFALNHAVSGLDPWSYHALNLILHFIASVLVFVLVRDHVWWPAAERGQDGAARWPAAAAALFFALAPLNSQPVVYIWARSALLCVVLYLGAFLAYLQRRTRLGGVLFALALLTKAIAVTLPVLLLVYDFVYRDRRRYRTVEKYVEDWRRVARPLAAPAAIVVAYLAYRWAVLPSSAADWRKEAWVTPEVWLMSQWTALLHYVRQFMWPDQLAVDLDYPYNRSRVSVRALGSLALLGTWVWLAVRALARWPQVTFATAWFFLTLAPESSVSPLGEVVNDHRPYIASALGLSVLLAWLLNEGAARCGRWHRTVLVAMTAILCVAAISFDRYRTWQWSDGVRIWEDTVRKSPENGRAWLNFGVQLLDDRKLTEARSAFERARALKPTYPYVHINFAILEQLGGNLEAALKAADEAVRVQPTLALGHRYRGQVLQKLGRTDEAAAAYRHALELKPNDGPSSQALAALGGSAPTVDEAMRVGLDALYTRHEPGVATEQFRRVLAQNPTHYGATYQLAVALDAAGKRLEARTLWEKVLPLAEQYKDETTAATARTRLGQQP